MKWVKFTELNRQSHFINADLIFHLDAFNWDSGMEIRISSTWHEQELTFRVSFEEWNRIRGELSLPD